VANDRYTGHELPAVITEVVLYDVFAPNWMLAELGSAGPMLVLPRARTDKEEPYSDLDVAAFWVRDATPFQRAPLALAAPAVGDPIWLAVRPVGDGSSRGCQAVVVESTSRTLVFRYAQAGSVPDYCSGAPLLNTAGEVVGINVGMGVLDGQHLGHANNVTSLRQHLLEGIEQSLPPGTCG
jgi:hypothetical protein